MTDGKFRLAKDRCTPTGHETGVFWLAGKPVIAPMVGWELTTAGTSVSCRPFHRGLQDGHGISARQQCFSSRSHLGIVAPRSRQKRVGYICRYADSLVIAGILLSAATEWFAQMPNYELT
jgi:hypothetical protein